MLIMCLNIITEILIVTGHESDITKLNSGGKNLFSIGLDHLINISKENDHEVF